MYTTVTVYLHGSQASSAFFEQSHSSIVSKTKIEGVAWCVTVDQHTL